MSDIPVDDDAELPEKEEKAALTTDEQIDAALAKSSAQEKIQKEKKKRMIRAGITLVILVLAYGMYVLFKPFKGGMGYGICKVFLELNVRYPYTLRYSQVEPFGTSIRIWYTQLDSFGEYRMEPIQCYYKASDTLPFEMEKITINRREVDPETVAAFNKTLPVIFAHPPDLTYPKNIADSLRGLQFETDKFRKPIL